MTEPHQALGHRLPHLADNGDSDLHRMYSLLNKLSLLAKKQDRL
jgi:hypothetical protein